MTGRNVGLGYDYQLLDCRKGQTASKTRSRRSFRGADRCPSCNDTQRGYRALCPHPRSDLCIAKRKGEPRTGEACRTPATTAGEHFECIGAHAPSDSKGRASKHRDKISGQGASYIPSHWRRVGADPAADSANRFSARA